MPDCLTCEHACSLTFTYALQYKRRDVYVSTKPANVCLHAQIHSAWTVSTQKQESSETAHHKYNEQQQTKNVNNCKKNNHKLSLIGLKFQFSKRNYIIRGAMRFDEEYFCVRNVHTCSMYLHGLWVRYAYASMFNRICAMPLHCGLCQFPFHRINSSFYLRCIV